MRVGRSIMAWKMMSSLGVTLSAMTSIHGSLVAAGPMCRTGLVLGMRDAGCEGDAEGWVADNGADFVVGYAVLFGARGDVDPHPKSV